MITQTVMIQGMENEQDAQKIERALHAIWGVNRVEVNKDKSQATFSYDELAASFHDFREALLEAGFNITTEEGTAKESLHDWQLERISRENVYTHDM